MLNFSDLIDDDEALSLYGFVYRVLFSDRYSYIGSKSVVGGHNWKTYTTSSPEVSKHWTDASKRLEILYKLKADDNPSKKQLKRLHMIESSYIYMEAANDKVEIINTTDAFRRHLPQLYVKSKRIWSTI